MRSSRTDATVSAQLELIFGVLSEVRRDLWKLRREMFSKQEMIMSALEDLQTSMAALITEATTDLEAVLAKLGTTPPDDTAALQALTAQANDAVAKLKADMAPLLTPAPATDPSANPSA